MNNKVSIVIITKDTKELLRGLLNSIEKIFLFNLS